MSSPPDHDPRSIAEGLFADLMLRPRADRERLLEELCAQRPELSSELRAMWRDLVLCGSSGAPGLSVPSTPIVALDDVPRVTGYRPLARIGSGGMGEVWEALELGLDRRVALKMLPLGALGSTVSRERFRREAIAAGRIQHPGIVTVFGAGEEAGRPWIAQELVPGGRTLRDRTEELRRRGEIPADHERTTAAICAQVAEALEAAHRAGIVHRDLKPQNILLIADDVPKVADFGLARLAGESSLSRTGEFIGTWLYASPEHLAPDPEGVDARSDVFSLGVVLYECLTLRRPFSGETSHEIAEEILRHDPPEPRRVRARVPRDLSTVCMKALEKRPGARYPSMQALAEDLRRFLAHESVLARAPGPVDVAGRWSRRHPVLATALALGSAALLALALLQVQTRAALQAAQLAEARESLANERLAANIEELRVSHDEARDAASVSEQMVLLLTGLFAAASPNLPGRGELTVRQLAESGAERLLAGEPAAPLARARLATTLAGTLLTLGQRDRAQALLELALELSEREGASDEGAALEARVGLVNLYVGRGELARALSLAQPLVALWRAGALAPRQAVGVLADLGLVHCQRGELEEARAVLEECSRLREEVHGARSVEAAFGRGLLAQVDLAEGRFAQGLARLEPDVDLLRPLLAVGNTLALDAFNTRGLFLQSLGRPGEARVVLQEALTAAADVLGPDHPRAVVLRTNLATVLEDLGRSDEAEVLLRESLELALARFGTQARETQHAKHDLATCWIRAGRLDEAEGLVGELLSELEEGVEPDGLAAARARLNLAYCLWARGEAARAAGLVERSLPSLSDPAVRAQAEAALEVYRRDARASDPEGP